MRLTFHIDLPDPEGDPDCWEGEIWKGTERHTRLFPQLEGVLDWFFKNGITHVLVQKLGPPTVYTTDPYIKITMHVPQVRFYRKGDNAVQGFIRARKVG